MRKNIAFFIAGLLSSFLVACDLQPKITSLPDTVGEFISKRYPTLLADPYDQPEIYNSAASDYGIYASTNLYGSMDSETQVEYANVNDYILSPGDKVVATNMYGEIPTENKDHMKIVNATNVDTGKNIISSNSGNPIENADYIIVPGYKKTQTGGEITVAKGDTLFSLARQYNVSLNDLATANHLSEPYPLQIGQKLKLPGQSEMTVSAKSLQNVPATKVDLQKITVTAGDTLYSLSRKYSVPVNDLAVMNNLSTPFTLSVGQVLKVPNSNSALGLKQNVKTATQTKEKISSNPNKKLPRITERSSSKFSWPVRGKVLSHYGAKSNGLFNDGININTPMGTSVKAAENGVVAYAGNELKGMGNLIIVQHSGGWMTVYSHLATMNVRRGTKVAVGQKIGTVGTTGKVTEPQLHFEIRKGTKAYDPESYLKRA